MPPSTTLDAAAASHHGGITVLVGAPNVVRGGSHSGNVAAETLARESVLDILSSDYVPASLLMGTFELARRIEGYGLTTALRTTMLRPHMFGAGQARPGVNSSTRLGFGSNACAHPKDGR